MTADSHIVAAVQLASGSIVQANLIEVEKQVVKAANAGASLIVLPENFGFMGNTCSDIPKIREQPGSGPLQDFLAQLAARLGVWIVGGTVPLFGDHPDKARAACLVYDERGACVSRYDKLHLFDVQLAENGEKYEESASFEHGERSTVVDSPVGRLGLAICYDLRFPELFRELVEAGAEIIALPAAFTAVTGKAHWETLVRARAIENLVYLIAAGQGGFHVNGRETHGHSMIVDPWGTILAEQARGAGVVTARIDHERLCATRRSFPCLEHRRLR
ncbi:MAG: carbon-nitrogen hydrolase family protein [Gammaproteobacteria bacterium]|jgi:predicted amidohydrolase